MGPPFAQLYLRLHTYASLGPRVLKDRRTPKIYSEDASKDVELQDGPVSNFAEHDSRVPSTGMVDDQDKTPDASVAEDTEKRGHIAWAKDVGQGKALRIPPPLAREQGESRS